MFGSRKKTLLAAGAHAPPFRLASLSGDTQSLEDILGRGPVLLAFFKVSCPVCKLSAPYLHRLSRNPGVQVIGISQDDPSVTRDFLERLGVEFPVLLDPAREGYPASNAFGISSVPSMFLIEPGGVISHAFYGFSKRDFQEIGARAGVSVFEADDPVPEWKAG
jgi:peroxiredoxin